MALVFFLLSDDCQSPRLFILTGRFKIVIQNAVEMDTVIKIYILKRFLGHRAWRRAYSLFAKWSICQVVPQGKLGTENLQRHNLASSTAKERVSRIVKSVGKNKCTWNGNVKTEKIRITEPAQWVKPWLGMHGNPSLDPRHHTKLKCGDVHLLLQRWGTGERQIPGPLWPASPAETARLSFFEKSHL